MGVRRCDDIEDVWLNFLDHGLNISKIRWDTMALGSRSGAGCVKITNGHKFNFFYTLPGSIVILGKISGANAGHFKGHNTRQFYRGA